MKTKPNTKLLITYENQVCHYPGLSTYESDDDHYEFPVKNSASDKF